MYCALRFLADKNLSERTYWYGSEFNLREGEGVLAPVGAHDKLQLGRVERVLETDPCGFPLKQVEARVGERVLIADGVRCVEAGGVLYDDRHYTRFRRALFTEGTPKSDVELSAYGVKKFLSAEGDVLDAIARAKGCVLVYGEGAERVGADLLALLKGEKKGDPALLRALAQKFF